MPKLELYYWDFDGGRGEVARIALSSAGIEFVDHRIKFPDWPEHKPNMPFGAMPVLLVDGQQLAQSNGINRYVGKLTGLYPEDALQAAFCDEAMDSVEDTAVRVVRTFSLGDEEKKRERQELVDGPLPAYVENLNKRLEERGGEYFADNRLTVADLKVFLQTRYMKSGELEHVPSDLVDRHGPLLAQHRERVKSHPKVAAYYAAR